MALTREAARRPAKTRAGRPPKDVAEETSARILDQAAKLFAAQGYAATSIEQVAAACGAGKDTIYRRYASKLALFEAVVERLRARTLDRLGTEVAAADGVSDALGRLRRIARWFLAINLDPEMVAFRRIAMSEAMIVGDHGRRADSGGDPILDRLVALIADAQAAGVLCEGDPVFLASHLLHCIVFGPVNDAALGHATYASAKAQDRYFESAWELFLHGTAARPQPARADARP